MGKDIKIYLRNSYIFNLDLTQNNKTYEGSLTGAVTT